MTAGMLIRVFVGIILLATCALWAQVAASGAEAAATGPGGGGGGMATPAPVSGEGYSMGFTSETRANYLRGGLIFSTAYDTDVTSGDERPASRGCELLDLANNLAGPDQIALPFDAILQSRLYVLPKHQFAQCRQTRILASNFKYRLSPHVTFSLRDSFQKTSSVLNQPNLGLCGARSPAAFSFPIIP